MITYHFCSISDDENGRTIYNSGIFEREDPIRTREDYVDVVDSLAESMGREDIILTSLTVL